MELNIIVFVGTIEGLIYYINRFIDHIRLKGINYMLVESNAPEMYSSKEFEEFLKLPNTVMFSFNNFGTGLFYADGTNVWKRRGIPVFDYIVDHPRNFADTFEKPACDMHVFTLDRNHVDFIRRFYPEVKGVYFSPNGGTEVGNMLPFSERPIDVIYMGGCQAEINDYPNIPLFDDAGQDFYITILGLMFGNPMLPTEKAIDMYLCQKGITLSEEDVLELNKNVAIYLENVIRRKTKLWGLKALDDAGIKVEVYGGGFEDEEIQFSDNIKLFDRIPLAELMPLIGMSKISLCFIPWYKRGCSEKNFDSMLNGALCVSDRSEYLDEHYTDGYNIIFFDLNNPSQMAADVKWLLSNPEAAAKIAQRGYETARENDDWNNRFDYVLKVMEEMVSD